MPLLRMSLRTRLTLWFVVIFCSIYLAVLGGVWLLHRDLAMRAIYQRINGLAEGVAMNMAARDAVLAPGTLYQYQPMDRRHSILAVRDEQGNIIMARFGVDTDALPPIPASPAAPNEGVLYSFEGETAKRLVGREISGMMITYRFTRSDGQVRFLDLARTIDIRADEQRFLIDAFIAGALGALVASVVAAWLIAGRAVDPIIQFADAARGVDPDHLDTRLRVGSSIHEYERLQTELNNALTRLEEGYRSQERFISHAAHDLKTPIAVMLTESQVFDPSTATAQEVAAYHESVQKEMRHLADLVEGFFMLARADQGEVLARRTQLSVNDFLLDCLAHCRSQASQNKVRLIAKLNEADPCDTPLVLHADPDLLRAMLENLVRNAIRHSPAGGFVELAATARDDKAVITVRDYGPGIPEELREKVFERYYVVPDRRNGSGLGLAIARSVAQLHGGTIILENAEGGGCLCVITLPLHGVQDTDNPQERTSDTD